jgi:hypothetical protein
LEKTNTHLRNIESGLSGVRRGMRLVGLFVQLKTLSKDWATLQSQNKKLADLESPTNKAADSKVVVSKEDLERDRWITRLSILKGLVMIPYYPYDNLVCILVFVCLLACLFVVVVV